MVQILPTYANLCSNFVTIVNPIRLSTLRTVCVYLIFMKKVYSFNLPILQYETAELCINTRFHFSHLLFYYNKCAMENISDKYINSSRVTHINLTTAQLIQLI